MSLDLDKLRKNAKQAEDQMYAAQKARDQALQKVYDQHNDKCRDAIDQAAAAQKALLDAEVAASLVDRDDGAAVARSLIEQGALNPEIVKAAGLGLD